MITIAAIAALAATAAVPMELGAKPARATAGWAVGDPAPADAGLHLQFFVRQPLAGKRALESTLMAVSEPDSPSYGAHLSNEAVHALVAPAPSSIAAVMGFLRDHGVVGVPATPNSDIIEAKVTMAQAEKMLATRYHVMVHNESRTKVHRAESYSLPAKVAAAVDFVCPTVHLPPVRKSVAFEPPAAVPTRVPWSDNSTPRRPWSERYNTPRRLREQCGIDVEGKAPDNKMAVTAFDRQYYDKSDLFEFWEIFCYGITCGKGEPTVKGDGVNGSLGSIPCFDDDGVCNQAMLDIETITGIAGNIHAELWGYKGTSPDNSYNEPFMKWLSELSNTSDVDVPKVFSTSYSEDEDAWSVPAATRMNTEFQKAGARGISLLYASGDSGANCEGINTPEMRFVPETPGSSPWVTSVGGTTDEDEVALSESAGGFSNRWPMPKWQSAAVATYLKTGKGFPNASLGYNVTGRAYPDIAAQATAFIIIANHRPTWGVSQTGCASPTASGVIALINDARLQAGKSVLGFLNPWIYANAKAWNDITSGGQEGCRSYVDGFPAAVGWDAVTGVGTPNYKNLVATGGGGGGTVCKYTEYCCPDAKHCLTPTKTSCASDGDAACGTGEVCCPLTKVCVTPGAACTSPCAADTEYCCPDAKHCLTPVKPGTFCTGPGTQGSCGSGEVCCPLLNECVTVGAACTAP